jgi:putative ABC transport system permease protein
MHDDLRNAIRTLRGSPAFTTLALSVLALGIGAATSVFSVVDAVVLRGLPFDEYDRLTAVLEHDTRRATTFGGGGTTPQTYLDWRRDQRSFDGLAAVGSSTFRVKNEGGEPGDARATLASWELFPLLRAQPLLGRAFTADDEVRGRNHVLILGYGFWLSRFGGAPDAVGRRIDLNEEPWEVVGVMPPGFSYPVGSARPAEMYAPIQLRDEDRVRGTNRNYNYSVIGRLKPGISIAQADGDMKRLAAALDRQYPEWSPGRTARVVALHEHLVGRVKPWMWMLLAAVALVLVIACANVANLMLARATVRAREIAVRAALGASRWRLVRQLLVEGTVLSVTGAAIGVLFAAGAVRVLRAWLPAGVPRVASIALDDRVLFAAVGAALLTGILCSAGPALAATRPDLTHALRDGGRGSTAGSAAQRLRSALVVAEVAIAVVLLVGAGLFISSFVKLVRIDPGFEYHNLLALPVSVRFDPAAPRESEQRGLAYVEQMLAAVRRVPRVTAAGAVNGGVPLTGSWSRTGVELRGRELKGDDDSIDRRSVTANYLEVLGIPLVHGRRLTDQDRQGAESVVVVNQAAARKYWPAEDALGQRIKINREERTVVGIVADIRHLGPEAPVRQEAYVPLAQHPNASATLLIRTGGEPMAVLPAVKAAIWSINREQRLPAEQVTLESHMDRLIAQRRFNMALLALFGALGLVIAAVGIYSVIAYVVAQRTNEIGVRMALGATPRSVVAMVLRKAAVLIAAGLAIGGAGAWYLAAGVKTFLFEVEPNDPRVVAGALVALAAAGLAASAVPARRAASVDPLVALRQE